MEVKVIDVEFKDFKGDIAAFMVFTDKYYILVETGPRATLGNLIEKLGEVGIKPKDLDYIVVTHVHLDHAGAAGVLAREAENAKIMVHPRGYPHLNNPEKLWRSSNEIFGDLAKEYGEPSPIPRSRLVSVSDGADLDVGEDTIVFIHTPGHASHHMVIYATEGRILFSGDALGCFYEGVIAPDTPRPHNYDDAIKSLKKLSTLKIDDVYFTHYGPFRPGSKAVERALEKWRQWHDILWEAYKEDLTVDEAYEMLLEKDLDARKVDRYFKSRPYGQNSLRNSIEGYLSYFKWKYEG
ncbi:hypothetical protein B6U99_01160 [Candidatus Geothermarchaeota archaeon ex4572_27]|nr:MAG: hypothetical protein B6U99_01160 [Candidatus Geothermarchaeota archaeon ex4572_27]